MKLSDYHKMNNLTTENEIREFYRVHQLGIYSCIKCGEIINDPQKPCPICGEELIKLKGNEVTYD